MSRRPFVVDPDIRRAQTPPGWVYTSDEAFDLARERILARSWQLVADTHQVATPGAVLPFTYCEGALDEPLVITRDHDDRLHCLSNVCTHRGMTLCEHPDHAKRLVCRYHGRRFDLAGRFQSMPEFEEAAGFPREEDHLREIPMRAWRQFLFASLDPAHNLDEVTREMEARIGFLPIDSARLDTTRARDYLVRANWALYIDNYLEGFHIPFVHASLAGAIDYGEYALELFPFSNLQLGVASGAEDCFDLPPGHPDAGKRICAWYFWLFPTTMFNVYPWGISVNIVQPLAPDRTRVRFLPYVWDESRLDRGVSADLDRVEREDESVVEAVHRAIASRHYTTGRYSPTREQCVHHFHRLLAGCLSP
jgi:choline monooxygenase